MNIHQFATADAWSSFCSIHPPSNFGVVEFFVFKRDCIPAYEAYEDGGQWGVELNIASASQQDELWLHAVQAMIGGDFGGINSCHLSGISLSRTAKDVVVALWVSEYTKTKVESVGAAFHKFLSGRGFSKCIDFVHFRARAKVLHSIPRGLATEDISICLQSPQNVLEQRGVWDTGQCDMTRPQHSHRVIVMPGFSAVDGKQLLFKNSFLHVVAPCEEPLPAPMLHRMRTA